MGYLKKELQEEYIFVSSKDYIGYIENFLEPLDEKGSKYRFFFPFLTDYYSFISDKFKELEISLFTKSWSQEIVDTIDKICELNLICKGTSQRLTKLTDKEFKIKIRRKEIYKGYYKKAMNKHSAVAGSYLKYIRNSPSDDEFSITMKKLVELFNKYEDEALRRD